MRNIFSRDLVEETLPKFWKPFLSDTQLPEGPSSSSISQPHPVLEPGIPCFCKCTSPVFQLSRIIGLSILSTNHDKPTPKGLSKASILPTSFHPHFCHSASLFSFPSLTNMAFTLVYTYFTVWIYQHLREHLGRFFHGVDYYTLAVDVVSNFVAATLLLIHARVKGSVFLRAMHAIQTIYATLKTANPQFDFSRRLQAKSIFTVVFILAVTIVYGSLFLYLIFAMTVPQRADPKGEWLTVTFVLQKLAHFFMPLYPQSFVALFMVCTEVVRELYKELAHKLKACLLAQADADGTRFVEFELHLEDINGLPPPRRRHPRNVSKEIETIRLLYEDLRKAVSSLSEYFGGSLLVICSIAVLSVTAAFYTIILNSADAFQADTAEIKTTTMSPSNEEQAKDVVGFFFIVWGFHLFFAFFILGGVLINGQRITFASQRVANVIQETPLGHIDNDTKFQISLLHRAVHGEPVEISACYITKMRMTFVASAVGNIITYILVLLQFRWSSLENK